MQLTFNYLNHIVLIYINFKTVHNIDRVDKDKFFFTFVVDDSRRHVFKLYKDTFNVGIGVFFFK